MNTIGSDTAPTSRCPHPMRWVGSPWRAVSPSGSALYVAVVLAPFPSRRRTGIEPARELVAPSTVLKTAGPTRNPDASALEGSRWGGAGRGRARPHELPHGTVMEFP